MPASTEVKVERLSKRTLLQACDFAREVFWESHPTHFDYPPRWFAAALERKRPALFRKHEIKKLVYFVAVGNSSKRVVGTTGYYSLTDKKQKDAYWLGWFGVHPDYRGAGLGTKLLDFIIKKTRRDHKKFLRLYTSSSPVYSSARRLYKKKGFVVTSTKRIPNSKYKKVYLELKV